jgi:DNA-nicking Smr family endonuclease
MSDDPVRRRRPRRLSEAERTLWSEVVRDIAPLRPLAAQPEHPVAEVPEPTAQPKSAARPKPQPQRLPAPPSREQSLPAPPPLAPLGRRMRQRIARGSREIGGRLDLHGMTQREAHDALVRFLRSAQDLGITLVLVITGKGKAGADSPGERGVLKRQVPQWLRLPALRELVIGFEPAHVTHGGEGALYVRLRRTREPR